MALQVSEGFGVVGDHGVKVEGLRVGEVSVGDGSGGAGPVGAEPAAESAGVVAGAEVVVTGFGVALLAFEFVSVAGRAGVGVGVLAAVRIEVGVIAEGSVVLGHDARGAEKVFRVILGIAAGGKHGDAFAAEEDILGSGVSGAIGFDEN